MANLDTFVTNLAGGGARANQFTVTIVGGAAPGGMASVPFLCRSAQIPAMTVGEVAVPYRGRQVFVAGDRTYDAWTVTVFNDANWAVRGGLETWMNALSDIGSSTTAATSPAAYYGTASIRQMDRTGSIIWGGSLYNVWPTTIDPIEFSYDTNDVVEEYGVTFRFNYMTTGPVGLGIGST